MTKDAKAHSVSGTPRALIHKQILDAAVANPNSSMEALADEVSGATMDLVERVIEQYGDPAEQNATTEETREEDVEQLLETSFKQTMSETNGQNEQFSKSNSSLTEKQLETLGTIREHPSATQAELAEILGVTSATINTRVNSIEGFDWEDRHEFVDEFAIGGVDDEDETPPDQGYEERQALQQRIQELEECVESLENRERDETTLVDDPELTHKILHACLDSDHIEAEEELDIVREFLD